MSGYTAFTRADHRLKSYHLQSWQNQLFEELLQEFLCYWLVPVSGGYYFRTIDFVFTVAIDILTDVSVFAIKTRK